MTGVLRVAAVLLLCALAGARDPTAADERVAAPVIIRVDPPSGEAGRDTGNSAPRPVATLGEALGQAALLRARHPEAAIVIELAAGIHRIDKAVRIGPGQGGRPGAPLIIRGASNGKASLWGSVALKPAVLPLPRALADRIPAEARSHVRVYRLPQALREPVSAQAISLLHARPASVPIEVYDRDGALVPARWPNADWAHVASGAKPDDTARFTLDDARPAKWRDEPDLWAEGYWRWNWLFESLPVRAVDAAKRRIELTKMPFEGILPNARVRVSHALSELDAPGEWWRDAADGLLIAWPRTADERIEVAVASSLLDIDGTDHVLVENVDLEHVRGDLVRVNRARDVVIRSASLQWAAGRAAAFEASENGGLVDCDFDGLGGPAVSLEGGDRTTLKPSGLFVTDSRFTRYMRLDLTQQAGVEIAGVGVTVARNLFHDAPAAAVLVHGNEHRIVGNELTRLLSGQTDEGAIYGGRDWTARGTVIEGNYLHDIHADPGFETKGIYLDDSESGFTIRRNLFVRVDQAVFIGGGRDNVVAENLFVASNPAIHVDSRGETWAAGAIEDPQSEIRAALTRVPTASPLWLAHYPQLAGILLDEPKVAKNNRLIGNVFVSGKPFDFSDGGRRERQIIADNVGPDGIHLSSGRDLATWTAGPIDADALADLVSADGRRVGLDLAASFRWPPR